MGEVDVERKEVERAILDLLELAPIRRNPCLQLPAPVGIRVERAAEEIALRQRQLLQLGLVGVDRARQEVAGQPLIVRPDQPRQCGTLPLRRGAVARDEVALRLECIDPFAIDVETVVAEEVRWAEEGIALKDVAVEVWQRCDLLDRGLAAGDDRQPEAELAEAYRLRLEIDAEERPLHDALPQVRRHACSRHSRQCAREPLDDSERREEERAGPAGRVQHGDPLQAIEHDPRTAGRHRLRVFERFA